MLLLNPFTSGILGKIANKKQTRKPTSNGYISKTMLILESELKLSESSFQFLQKSLGFCTLYPRGYTEGGPTPTTPGATSSGSQHSRS